MNHQDYNTVKSSGTWKQLILKGPPKYIFLQEKRQLEIKRRILFFLWENIYIISYNIYYCSAFEVTLLRNHDQCYDKDMND